MTSAPLSGVSVVACASGAAAGYALRYLATLGAEAVLIEPEDGSALRRAVPFLPGGGTSALFAYLTAGSRVQTGGLDEAMAGADIFLHDTPVAERKTLGLTDKALAERFPNLIPVSVLPFGAHGPKAGWKGEDITIIHASGEGYLLPNGLSIEQFPDRPPVKPYGHFAEYQGGIAAALGALTALWARDAAGAQSVDVSSQDAALAVGAFAIQRLGDGQVEHRVERSFRFGGVIECADGYVELLTLEQRQWDGLVTLMGDPAWAQEPALADTTERSRRGAEINRHIRAWAKTRMVEDVVREGQKLSVPLAKYMSPADVLADPHERHRGLFQQVDGLDMLVSPFHFDGAPLFLLGTVPNKTPNKTGGAA
jgi:crotonobetainyl-CoA:carnitine CoA-transferase CaiB-like acyl-CoA transferase